MTEAAPYRQYRSPQDDGQTLVDPPRSILSEVVARSRRHLATLEYDVQGRPLGKLMADARRTLVEAAANYTRQYRDMPTGHLSFRAGDHFPIILSGHQPQLFHPGVWYKNFVLGDVAAEVGGLGVHLLIDSDLCRAASIRVPTGTVDEPRLETVPLDQPSAEVPYEERAIEDETVFGDFSHRVVELLRPLVAHPLVEELWPLVQERSLQVQNLGLRLAQGRHQLEATWGNDTLELPQSAVCQLPAFTWFVAHVLAHLPRFWAAYNDSLASYRRAHHLRDRATPVPDLSQSDGWLEAPFWLWTSDDPRRRPVFARQQGDELLLTDRHEHTVALALSADRDADAAAEQLLELASRGIKLRTRALATTLFARLLASDLFLHGIGGAKYDQVTDQIAQSFFSLSLPEFATVSATLRLPIVHPASNAGELRTLRQKSRELDYHPEQLLIRDGELPINNASAAAALIADKRRWVQTPKTPQNASTRHTAIVSANQALQPFVTPQRWQLDERSARLEYRLRANSILESREYSFCLFPRDQLARLLDAAAPKS